MAEVCPYWVRLDVDRVDGATEVSRCRARPVGQADLNALTGTGIRRWNTRTGTKQQPFPVRAQQEDACKYIISGHLLDGPEMPIEDPFQAIASLEFGRNF